MHKLEVQFSGGQKIVVSLRQPATPTVTRLLANTPFRSLAHRWGDEVYFSAPFHSNLEDDSQQEMEVGDAAFWPEGDAIAIFFGPTPVSKGLKPRAYSACNMLGWVNTDASILRKVQEGDTVAVRMI